VVTYDPIRVFSLMSRALDWVLEGIWDEVTSSHEDLLREAKSLADDAATLIANSVEAELLDFVGDDDVAHVAAALAVAKCEGWDASLEIAMDFVAEEAARRYRAALERGDI